MPVRKLKEFLDAQRVKYVTISHSRAFTAQEVAASAHVSGKELAKTVIVRLDGKMAMVVVPAATRIDFDRLKRDTKARKAELAGEQEFRDLFPECELGAMPPFGNLYGMEIFVSDELAHEEHIVFAAGSHIELMRLRYEDFERLVKPRIIGL